MRFSRLRALQPLKDGYTLEESRQRFINYHRLLRTVVHLMAGWMPRTGSTDVKILFGIHLYEDAQFVTRIGERLEQMGLSLRNLPAPDEPMNSILEFLHSRSSWEEFAAAVYNVLKPLLIDSVEEHSKRTDEVLDEISTRILQDILRVTSQHVTGGMVLVESVLSEGGDTGKRVHQTTSQLRDMLQGLETDPFDSPVSENAEWKLKQMGAISVPARENYIQVEENREEDQLSIEQFFHDLLNYELIAAELFALILHNNPDHHWLFLEDMARLVWDETRHAHAVEAFLDLLGVKWGDFPVSMEEFRACAAKPLGARLTMICHDEREQPLRPYFEEAIKKIDAHEDRKVRNLLDYLSADEAVHVSRCWYWAENMTTEG